MQSTPGPGVHYALLRQIVGSKPVSLAWRPPNPPVGFWALGRMRRLLGLPYDLIRANCEHAVRWAATDRWESSQVQAVRRIFR